MRDQGWSPYEAVLGDELWSLQPRLRTYFSVIADGCEGVGEGVFATVGTPRRWLHPFIRALAPSDVVFPVWEKNVPFTVINSAVVVNGKPAVAAERRFHLAGGDRVMRDLIVRTSAGLVDVLGRRRRIRVRLEAQVIEGELRMRSRRVELRIASWHIRLFGPLAPRVELTERFSHTDGRQHVTVEIRVPLLGKVYEYEGSFAYEIRPGDR